MAIDSGLVSRLFDLPPRDRAQLAHDLLLSLEPGGFDRDADERWAEEIATRLAAVDRGDSVPVDAKSAIARIRDSLAKGRPAR